MKKRLLLITITTVMTSRADEPPAKLTTDQICSLNAASVWAELRETQKLLIEAEKRLMLIQACNKAKIWADVCDLKADYTLVNRAIEPPTAPATK